MRPWRAWWRYRPCPGEQPLGPAGAMGMIGLGCHRRRRARCRRQRTRSGDAFGRRVWCRRGPTRGRTQPTGSPTDSALHVVCFEFLLLLLLAVEQLVVLLFETVVVGVGIVDVVICALAEDAEDGVLHRVDRKQL